MASVDLKEVAGVLDNNVFLAIARREEWGRAANDVLKKLEALVTEANPTGGASVSLKAEFGAGPWSNAASVWVTFASAYTGLDSWERGTTSPVQADGAKLAFTLQLNGMVAVGYHGWGIQGTSRVDSSKTYETLGVFQPSALRQVDILRSLMAQFLKRATADHWSMAHEPQL